MNVEIWVGILIVTVAVAAGIVQNIAGFGAGVVLLLVLPRFFDVVTAATLNQAICSGMTIIMAWRYRKYLEIKKVLIPALCFMVAAIFTIRMLKNIDLKWLGVAMGVFLLFLSLYYLFWQKKIDVHPTPLLAVVFGLLAGVLSGLFSIGATLMAMYFLALTADRNHYMADLQMTLAMSNIVSFSTRVISGLYTKDLIGLTVLGFAAILLGQFIGSKIAGRLNANTIKKIIYVLVGLTGIETIIKQLAGILAQ